MAKASQRTQERNYLCDVAEERKVFQLRRRRLSQELVLNKSWELKMKMKLMQYTTN